MTDGVVIIKKIEIKSPNYTLFAQTVVALGLFIDFSLNITFFNFIGD